MISQKPTINKNQQGMVSIIVTLVLMIVITLVVLGFAQNSRREQRQALDRQLSTQAFYAAESGINDATKAIQSGTFLTDKTTCTPNATFTGVIDPANKISYTCLLISQSTDTIKYQPDKNMSISADMTFKDPTSGGVTTANEITIKWHNLGGGTSGASYPTLSSTGSWGGSALLRLAMTDLGGPSPYARDNLNTNTFTTFLYPSSGAPAGSTTFKKLGGAITEQGRIVNSGCNGTDCTAVVSLGGNLSHVFLRIGTIYKGAEISITAKNGANTVNITGAQAVIDATGKAQDVLRRVQVRLPLQSQNEETSTTVQSVEGICKQLQLRPVSGSSDGC